MKPRIITSVLLFISAYSPLFLILGVKDFDFKLTHQLKHPLVIYALLGITVLSVILLFASIKSIKRGTTSVEIVSVKNRSVDLINYTIPYMLSFLGIDLSKPEDIIAISIFMLMMLLLTITTKSIFINPVLALVGYGLYDVEYKFDAKTISSTVISKYNMHQGEQYYIVCLTRFLYFVKEQKVKTNE